MNQNAMSQMPEATNATQYGWTITAYEKHGNLWVKWSTTAAFRAQEGQISVYTGSFPKSPTDNRKGWCWDDSNGKGRDGWDTGLPAGSGWHVAWIAQTGHDAPYIYVVQVVTP